MDNLTSFVDDSRHVLRLPIAPYTDEWKILDTDDVPLKRYAALGLSEQAVTMNLVALVWDLT